MASPSTVPAEGSSQTTGGLLCGKAMGNVVNLADMQDVAAAKPVDSAVKGIVKVYISDIEPSELDFKNMKPITKVTIKVNTNIGSVLAEVANWYPAIKHKFFIRMLQL